MIRPMLLVHSAMIGFAVSAVKVSHTEMERADLAFALNQRHDGFLRRRLFERAVPRFAANIGFVSFNEFGFAARSIGTALTFSSQSTTLPSIASWIAIWLMPVVADERELKAL